MPSLPFRKRSALRTAAKTARNVAVADAVWALARDRLLTKVPGVEPRKRRPGLKLFAAGGAVALLVGGLLSRKHAAKLLPSRSSEDTAPAETAPPPGPANYDAPGPVANTATPLPVPPPYEAPAVDVDAEEAAAAAEAANIGGGPTSYAGPEGAPATPAEAPLMEAGEGESEGQEQAEAELAENAAPSDGMSDAERQIQDSIDAADNPALGEHPKPVPPPGH